MSAMPRLFWAPIKSRQDLIELARTGWASFGHAVGTARIGADADAGGGQRASRPWRGPAGRTCFGHAVDRFQPDLCSVVHDRRPRCRNDQVL
jgi:hypothetical protein